MRPPILFLTIGFGVGLWAGLDPVAFPGAAVWGVAVPVVVVAAVLAQPAPLGAAVGIMGVAGLLWGGAAVRERGVTCAGRWSREQGAGSSKAAIVRLLDPAPDSGGAVDADVVGGACGGALRLKWPEGYGAAGGTTWVVAGRWTGFGERGVLVVRRAHQLDPVPRRRAALARLPLAARVSGARAPRRGDARRTRHRPAAPARRRAQRQRRPRGARGARRRSLGDAVGGRVALGRLDRRRDLGGTRGAAAPARGAARRSGARRHARDRADHRVRVRHRRADRGARESRGDPARGDRRPGAGDGPGALVADAGAGAAGRRGCGRGSRAARSHRAGRGAGPRRARRDGRRLAGGGAVGRRGARRLVAVELAPSALAFRRTYRLRLRDLALDVRPRRRSPRRLSVSNGTFSRCGTGGRRGAADAAGPLDRDRRRPPDSRERRRAAGGDSVPAAPRCGAARAGGGDPRRRRSSGRAAGRRRCVRPRAGARARRAARPAAVPRVSGGGRGVGRPLARGPRRRPDRAGRGRAGGAQPGLAVDGAAARRERARRGAAGDVRRGAAAVPGRRGARGGGTSRGPGRPGGGSESRPSWLAQRHLGRVARGAAPARGCDQRRGAEPLRPSRAGGAGTAGAVRYHDSPDR